MSKRRLAVVEGYILESQCEQILESSNDFLEYEHNIYSLVDDVMDTLKGTGLKVFYMNKKTGYSKYRQKETILVVGYPVYEGEGKLANGQIKTLVGTEVSLQSTEDFRNFRSKFKLDKVDINVYLIEGILLGAEDAIDWKDI